jgi:hypothetical protein
MEKGDAKLYSSQNQLKQSVSSFLADEKDRRLIEQLEKLSNAEWASDEDNVNPREVLDRPLLGNVILKVDSETVLGTIMDNIDDSYLSRVLIDKQDSLKELAGAGYDVIRTGIGDVNKTDILIASAAGAKIIAYGVGVTHEAQRMAASQRVAIQHHDLISRVIESIQMNSNQNN